MVEKIPILKPLEITATLSVILGVALISRPCIVGHYIMILAQMLWLIYAKINKLKFLSFQCIVLLILEVTAVYNWSLKSVG